MANAVFITVMIAASEISSETDMEIGIHKYFPVYFHAPELEKMCNSGGDRLLVFSSVGDY